MSWIKINKEDVSEKELNSLHPAMELFKEVNYSSVEYYKDNNTNKLWEISVCIDGSLNKRIKELEEVQNKRELIEYFGF